MPPGRQWPSVADWANQRERISRLYRCSTLQQVQQVMARQYNFHATLRMYRTRLTAWGQDKKHKAHEMQSIAKEAYQQRCRGQAPRVFMVRGRIVTFESVERYYRRRKMTVRQAVLAPPTVVGGRSRVSEHDASLVSAHVESTSEESSGQESNVYTPEAAASKAQSIPATPSAPLVLARPERAIRDTVTYILGSLESHFWCSNLETGEFLVDQKLNSTSSCRLYDHMNNFHCQSRMACDLFNRACFEDGGIFLAAATIGIKELTKAQWPPIPTYLPHTLHSILTRGKPEVAVAVLGQFARFAELFHGRTHPIYQFCCALASVEKTHLKDIVCCILSATQDVLSQKLGPLHRTTLGVRYAHARTLSQRSGPAAFVNQVERIANECQAELDPNDVRTITWRLHLARWILNPITQSTPKQRQRARRIVSEERARLSPASLDAEAIANFTHVHRSSFVSEYKLSPSNAEDSAHATISCHCNGTLSYIDHACNTEDLFWPKLFLWEGTHQARDGEDESIDVLRHIHTRPLLVE